VRIDVEKPADFSDIKNGDSISTNGVCLTVESFDANTMSFALGSETLAITGWSADSLKTSSVKLERSLRLGDRIHGHCFWPRRCDGRSRILARPRRLARNSP